MKLKISEAQIQCMVMRWFYCQYPKYHKLFFHIPNGGSRDIREAANLKRQGVKKGIPDTFLAVPNGEFHGLFLELKSATGRISEEQAEMIELLTAQGYAVVVANSFDTAKAAIEAYMNGL